MNTPEHVFALFVEANPVVGPGELAVPAESKGETMHVVDRDELVEERRPTGGGTPVRRGWKPAMVAAVVVLLVGVVGLAAVLFTTNQGGPVAAESAVMEVTFDGSTCIYTGPTQLLAGEGRVGFERTPDAEPFALVVSRLEPGEDAVDVAAAEEWAATHSAQVIPPWVAGFDVDYLSSDVVSSEIPVTFEAGRYLVSCNTSPAGTDRVHVGNILTVTSG